jgi:hypothetical protein
VVMRYGITNTQVTVLCIRRLLVLTQTHKHSDVCYGRIISSSMLAIWKFGVYDMISAGHPPEQAISSPEIIPKT